MLLLYDKGNGYYEELRILLEEDGQEDATFEFMENEVYDTPNSAYDYLHGLCPDFAIALADEFGYKIETIHDSNGNLIHAYCISEYAGKKAYIDIRGITTNPNLFYEDFEDWLTYENGVLYAFEGELKVEVFDLVDDYTSTYDELSEFYWEANFFISLQKHFYQIEQ